MKRVNQMVLFRSHCKSCSDFGKYYAYTCSMKCSIKGNSIIKPTKITVSEFSKVLQNNIGITLSITTMRKNIKEIKKFISE